jgi:hypothetical protein
MRIDPPFVITSKAGARGKVRANGMRIERERRRGSDGGGNQGVRIASSSFVMGVVGIQLQDNKYHI